MVTFSDCMNLLLTFFVLLVTFSSFGEDPRKRLLNLGAAMRAQFGAPVQQAGGIDRSAVPSSQEIWAVDEPLHGSDMSTNLPLRTGHNGAMDEDLQANDHYHYKVFVVPSRRVFLGKTATLSPEGRYLMAVMAAFLKEMPARVVLSENGPAQEWNGQDVGLSRAWAVIDFFATAHDLDRQRFSISTQSTLIAEAPDGDRRQERDNSQRMLEIVLLEWSVQR
ncbi:MAG: hypothetical protein A2Y76_06935 [Planctomycetes bacterium RBG_13_60_9]|nr:MAG: hypothetical protein A2Y76_06935 [Planctomycetes bacterium RBG_13_60_9]